MQLQLLATPLFGIVMRTVLAGAKRVDRAANVAGAGIKLAGNVANDVTNALNIVLVRSKAKIG